MKFREHSTKKKYYKQSGLKEKKVLIEKFMLSDHCKLCKTYIIKLVAPLKKGVHLKK